MASLSLWNAAVHRLYSGVEPRFKSNFAKAMFLPREIAYQSGVALNAPSTNAGAFTLKPWPRRYSASFNDWAVVFSVHGRLHSRCSAFRPRSSLTSLNSG
jgi:hypothetical protein